MNDQELARVEGFAEADEILGSRRFAQESKHESAPLIGGTVLVLDGPGHLHRRRLLSPLVTRGALADYHDVVARTLDRCLAEAVRPEGDRWAADLVPFGRAVFLQFAAALIGFDDVTDPAATAELLHHLGPLLEAVTVEWSTRDHATVIAEGEAARDALVDRFHTPAARRRAALVERGDAPTDLLSLLAAHGAEWDDDAAVREVVLFLAASTLNNAALLVHTAHALGGLVDDPTTGDPTTGDPTDDELRDAVFETLRLRPPTVALVRRALGDVRLRDGRLIREGEHVAVDLVAANRDPAVFGPDADAFRPGRPLPDRVRPWGLAFGSGPHLCLGRAVVTGSTAAPGVHVQVLRALLALGVRPDPDRPPVLAASAQVRHDSYPVLLTRPR
ncbi:cytochrome P450 [Pseudonocardia broussonetiae]|uniref:Cytochrome P450 n=1 Tax=Pseudonocardia broussonetiae TaxID=2736640 RepID=A0A6M6JQR9_9PSEU|nr:cytochrome P450 [Pseudonocardia broussonetiae]QJY49655.1 cytochrome P450 [Pseudonocardia broussonetiae]